MNTTAEVMAELKKQGSANTCKIYARHGIRPPMFGVSVANLKLIAKKIRARQDLALSLYDTGNYDAMYLAGIIADGAQMTQKQLDQWAKTATSEAVCGSVVAVVASASPLARKLALKWIDSKTPSIAICGWGTYGGIVATTPDDELDLEEIQSLLDRVVREIHTAPNRVRYMMNNFVIAVGGYVKPLLKEAKRAAKTIGAVEVDMGETACQVPLATEYIAKIEKLGRVGKKRKSMKC